MGSLSASDSTRIKYIGLYQIIGGIVGLLSVFWAEGSKGIAIVIATGCSLFVMSIASGWLVLTGHKQGFILSILNQSLQVLTVGVGSFFFSYCAGVYLSFGVDFANDIRMTADAGLNRFEFNVNVGDQWTISFDAVAIWLISALVRLQRQIREDVA